MSEQTIPIEENQIESEKEDSKQEREKEENTNEVIKVNKWNLSDLKNACDDYVQKFLTTKAQYSQHHTHTDIKLLLGYLSCIFALVGGSYTYITPFHQSKGVTSICLVAYLTLNGLMMAYSFLIEKDIIFVGSPINVTEQYENYHVLTIHTTTDRYSDLYNITFEVKGGQKNSNSNSTITTINNKYTITRSYGNWFDVKGVLDCENFEKLLLESLNVAISGEKPHEQ
ncbi:hypothetical protein G9A89_017089 [Geosiphon pyriformis]|nr:hypothetical protein G9A89_017089 [Geosiphon pyriformis]